MSVLNQEVVGRLSVLQQALWEQAATAATEAFGKPITLSDPLAVAAKTQDITSDMSGPMVVLKFALASSPDNHQLILVPPDLAKELASVIKMEEVGDLGEDVLADLKPVCQALATGLCAGIAAAKGTEDGLITFTVLRQIVELPEAMEQSDEVARVQVGLAVEDVSGSITWLFDEDVAKNILGIEDSSEAFEEVVDATPVLKVASARYAELDMLLDIPLQVSVELGRVKMLVQDVVDLSTGSVVEIDKAAGDPVDVLVNGKLVARGEVVVIEDNFGVRITEIVTPQERVANLGDAA